MKMKDKKKAEETAEMRMQMIAPLLAPNLGYNDIARLKNDISAGYEVSVRTLERYCKSYVDHGFTRSIPTIIQILEMEGTNYEKVLLRRRCDSLEKP